jgi:hypothetical protein
MRPFQGGHSCRNRRLRQPKRLRGTGDVLAFGHGQKDAQLLQCHE